MLPSIFPEEPEEEEQEEEQEEEEDEEVEASRHSSLRRRRSKAVPIMSQDSPQSPGQTLNSWFGSSSMGFPAGVHLPEIELEPLETVKQMRLRRRSEWNRKVGKRQKQMKALLARWHEQKQEMETSERELEEEQKQKELENQRRERDRWKKYGEELHQKLSDMIAKRKQKEEDQQELHEARKREDEKKELLRQRRLQKQKELILTWRAKRDGTSDMSPEKMLEEG